MTLKHHGAYGAICFDDGQAEWPKRRWSWSPDVWDWPEKRSLPDDIFCIVTVGTGWNPAYDPASGPPPSTETLTGHYFDFLGGFRYESRGFSLSVFAGPMPTRRDGQGSLRSAWDTAPARASVCANSWHASFWSGVSAVGPLCVAKGDDTNNGAAVSVPPGEELPGAVWAGEA